MRDTGKWILPQPEPFGKVFIPIPRLSRIVPFGYEVDESDPDVLQPIQIELQALEKAKKYLRQYSYREVANWLSAQTGRQISHMGLKKRIENEVSNKQRAKAYRIWAKRLQEALQKAEEYENARVGAGYDRADIGSCHN